MNQLKLNNIILAIFLVISVIGLVSIAINQPFNLGYDDTYYRLSFNEESDFDSYPSSNVFDTNEKQREVYLQNINQDEILQSLNYVETSNFTLSKINEANPYVIINLFVCGVALSISSWLLFIYYKYLKSKTVSWRLDFLFGNLLFDVFNTVIYLSILSVASYLIFIREEYVYLVLVNYVLAFYILLYKESFESFAKRYYPVISFLVVGFAISLFEPLVFIILTLSFLSIYISIFFTNILREIIKIKPKRVSRNAKNKSKKVESKREKASKKSKQKGKSSKKKKR